jgi:Predicted glycosyltransferases
MNKTPILSFITVSYNGAKDTLCLIKSILSIIKNVSYEIIVVDNASIAQDCQSLKKGIDSLQNKTDIVFIQSKTNLGFAGGNNLGIDKAKGKYLFFVNNDTYFTYDEVSELIYVLDKDKMNGGVSPKILFPKELSKNSFSDTILFEGFTPLSKITLRNKVINYGYQDSPANNKERLTPYLHGAAMMLKKEVIEKVGKMPECFFLYYEELDWSLAIRRQGFKLYYCPLCTIYHNESQSTGKNSSMQTFYQTRNRLLLAKRNLDGIAKPLSIAYQIFIACPIHWVQCLVRGNTKNANAIVKGIISFINYKN